MESILSSYRVKISPQAYEELDGIYKYIATNLSNPTAAFSKRDGDRYTKLR
ncbi:hypothetical protein [Campylobacter sp. RM16187]|uniref:hypothetical protein n=1 Tax=Campylobacter sp. RM16187 TaxID=1660063 RepID=UPI0021B4F63A|nr:hypothetical protein [Campylobacter sp. RM16187]